MPTDGIGPAVWVPILAGMKYVYDQGMPQASLENMSASRLRRPRPMELLKAGLNLSESGLITLNFGFPLMYPACKEEVVRALEACVKLSSGWITLTRKAQLEKHEWFKEKIERIRKLAHELDAKVEEMTKNQ